MAGVVDRLRGRNSYRWWWVRRYGELPCGCTQNPVTRRRLLSIVGCYMHMPPMPVGWYNEHVLGQAPDEDDFDEMW